MSANQCSSLQHPQLTILGLHEQILLSAAAVLTVITDDYMHAFTPCCIIVYREFQFHGFATFLQKYEIIMNYVL